MQRLLFLPLATLIATGPAQAGPASFETLDTDGNGTVSRAEFLEIRRSMFAYIDADQSGTLTAAEIDAARQSMAGSRQAKADKRVWSQDANGDGLLTIEEYTSQTRGFDFADRNNDGQLSPAEFQRVARFLAKSQ